MPFPSENTLNIIGYYDGSTDPIGDYSSGNTQIGMATSLDGGDSWTPNFTPVLQNGMPMDWDGGGVMKPWSVKVGNKYYMYYAGYNTGGPIKIQIGMATSNDGVNWTKYVANPVVANVKAYDANVCNYPVVWYDANEFDPRLRWKMLYQGVSPLGATSINAAFSPDGFTWTRLEDLVPPIPGATTNPVLVPSPAVANDDFQVFPGCVYFDGYWYLLYAGAIQPIMPLTLPIFNTFLAYSRDFINWEKFVDTTGNPVPFFGARNVPGLVSPLAVGQQEIQVTPAVMPTPVFEINEPIVLYQDPAPGGAPIAATYEMLYKVKGISVRTPLLPLPGGNNILLDKPLMDFNGATGIPFPIGTVVSSIFGGSLFPRMILKQGDMFKIALSCFRFIPEQFVTSGEFNRGCVAMARCIIPEWYHNNPIPQLSNQYYFKPDLFNAPALQAGRYSYPDCIAWWDFRAILNLCGLLTFKSTGDIVNTDS